MLGLALRVIQWRRKVYSKPKRGGGLAGQGASYRRAVKKRREDTIKYDSMTADSTRPVTHIKHIREGERKRGRGVEGEEGEEESECE